MQIPYVYVIEHIPSNRFYIGVRFANSCYPEELLQEDGYLTSSPSVHKLIKDDGLSSFKIDRIRTFATSEDALKYETRFLRKVGAKANPKLINAHENKIPMYGSQEFGKMMMKVYGVDNCSKHPDIKKKKQETCLKNYGVDNPVQSHHVLEQLKISVQEKYGVDNVSKHPDVKKKKQETCVKNYGTPYYMQSEEGKQAIKETLIKKYGVDNCSKHPDIKKKKETSAQIKYGVNNVFQSEEIKEESKKTNLSRYGVEYYSQSNESKNNIKKVRGNQASRPQVKIIKNYVATFKLALGRGWYQRSDEWLDEKIKELTLNYGHFSSISNHSFLLSDAP